MTDKEFKRLNRAQLIEIIYKLQVELDELIKQNQSLENALEDKRLRINNAGNLAEAALEINNCFISAQNAAEQYLNEIKEIKEETKIERKEILETAKKEAMLIISAAKKSQGDFSEINNILDGLGLRHLDNG